MKIRTSRSVPLLAWAVIAGLSLCLADAADPAKLKVGDKAPLIQGTDQDGKTINLGDLVAKKIVLLYFYPKDETPGCTKEACGFRDGLDDLKKANVQVIGVSFDSADSHQKFISKHSLNFPLLADTDGKIADAYGAKMANKNMDRRVSFLIGMDGNIAHITDTGNADTHLAEMKEAVEIEEELILYNVGDEGNESLIEIQPVTRARDLAPQA